jgi:hypothetical protein
VQRGADMFDLSPDSFGQAVYCISVTSTLAFDGARGVDLQHEKSRAVVVYSFAGGDRLVFG